MPSTRPLAAVCLALFAAGAAGAQVPAASTLAGQWRFETAVGASTSNGVTTDEMGQGIFTITRSGKGLAGTISWLDERGHVTSARQVEGRLTGAGAVFTHGGKRVTSGRNGRDIVADVTIRWTLQAQGDRLVGQRLVETDEDEPKPVTGVRVAARDLRPLAALLPAPAAAPSNEPAGEAGRGPSTPEERARVLRIAQEAQQRPREAMQRDGAWLKAWVEAIPDLSIDYGSTAYTWLKGAAHPEARDALRFQYTASAMAFQIRHPESAQQQAAIDDAAMDGVLHAYATLLRRQAAPASPALDRALAARDKGQLAAFLAGLSGRDPLPASFSGMDASGAADPAVRRMLALGQSEPRAMEWLDILSNRFGGRMTGSDAYTHAAAWTRSQLRQWGIEAELEEAGQVALGFNRGPWTARMVAPVEQLLRIATPAYTAGTRGVQHGLAVIGPATLDEAQARAAQFRDKWVLIGGLSSGSGRDGEYRHQPRAIMRALEQAGALGTIQAGEEPLSSGAAAPTSWDALPNLPDIKLAESQYADIRRRVAASEAVTLEFDIRNWFYPGPVAYHNVMARIPGAEKPEEIVLLGAHLDSFDGAAGAADNGANVATMLEAMRLLAAAGIKPRRTIMLAAFAAEENGLTGSSAFARQHAVRLPGVVMMLNRDGRPGAISGMTIPSAWNSVFARVEQDLRGVHPAFAFEAGIDDTPRERAAGRTGSDDIVFAAHGIPTPRFSVLTDFDYGQVHHTVADTYDKVLPFRSAQQYSAMAIAAIAWEVANAPEAIARAGYYRSAAP
ncbi:M20/M25/M40 family metallo-hydrolase [Massilia sp. G4R7]|uniref:Carboxypeptidase Q n=1 Tax=Massilia phyllostachyos TaxID=2898585 RepID=A0ABS8Q5B2_9BURK|nr:M20/M25/M40 family metallo-hydrolase [Massilia phyllostachyos]MCD2516928.1 M20/M25/M40 family metallo-hydrolase [Massilia phyllostachyos]